MRDFDRTVLVAGSNRCFNHFIQEKRAGAREFFRTHGVAIVDGIRYVYVQTVPDAQGYDRATTTYLFVHGDVDRDLEAMLLHHYPRSFTGSAPGHTQDTRE